MYPESSVISVILTLINTRPILRSSGSKESWTLSRNLSRSLLISSIAIEAITWRNWPKMISLAWPLTSSRRSPNKRMAAFCITAGSVPMATVKDARYVDTNVLGRERAP